MTVEIQSNDFIALADIALHNPDLQHAVGAGTRGGYQKRAETMFAHSREHGEHMRQQAAEAKRRALRKLPDLLETAERNLQANGWKVEWAEDAAEANQLVLDIAQRHAVETVTKSKSMLSEELGVNHALEAAGLRVVETDLGEYIIQLNNETPSHIVAPVMHKTKAEIRDIFVRELDMEPTDDAEQMVAFARKMLREDFLNADMGISGGNFLIAETGSIGLVMNEGNGRMCTSMPRVHVALVGIEKAGRNSRRLRDADTGAAEQFHRPKADRLYQHPQWTGPRRRGRRSTTQLRHPGRQWQIGNLRQRLRRGANLHPLRRMSKCLPGLSQHWWPCLRLGLWGSDWRGADAALGRLGECDAPAPCQQSLRQLQAGLPG